MHKQQTNCPRYGSLNYSSCRDRSFTSSILLLLVAFVLFPVIAKGQSGNLISNPSFETVNCPTGYSGAYQQIEQYVPNWYSGTRASPDPFTNCGTPLGPNSTMVPNIIFGYQYARTGNNFLGFGFYGGWYEYIGSRLKEKLKAGKKYHISFYVSRADQVRYSSNKLGIYFSQTMISGANNTATNIVSYTPQFLQDTAIYHTTDTGWSLVSGTYTANGTEEYMMLGCFEPWNTAKLHDTYPAGTTRCYYYIDDVSIIADEQPSDNAGIRSLVSPVNFCGGVTNVEVEIENAGKNNISHLYIGWELNGIPQPPVAVNQSLDTFGSATGNTRIVTLGSVNIPARTIATISAWTYAPNSVSDPESSNDTLRLTIAKPGISGTFTIGGMSPDYTDVASAIADIDTIGVCGPVIFNIRTGSYNEKISISGIPGTSAVNTITFQSEAGHHDSVEFVFATTSATEGILTIAGASYTRFKKLTFKQISSATSTVVALIGSTFNNIIEDCYLYTAATTATNTFVVNSTSVGTRGFVLRRNKIEGGYTGVNIVGTAATGMCMDNVIEQNAISKAYFASISMMYTVNSKVRNNHIVITQQGYASHSGIALNAGFGSFEISGNKIHAHLIACANLYAIKIDNSKGDANDKGSVFNNHISVAALGNTYGLYSAGSTNYNCYHNSIHTYGEGSLNYPGYLNQTPGANVNIRNNIFFNRGLTGYAIWHSDTATLLVNNNLYYSNSPGLIYKSAAPSGIFTSLLSWQMATGLDNQSSSSSPDFASFSDLHLRAGCKTGVTISGFSTDIEGTVRSNPPSLGAYEYSGINNLAVSEILYPVKGNVTAGHQNVLVVVKNTGVNTITSFTTSYKFNNGSVLSRQWTGTLLPCDTAHILFSGTNQVNIPASGISELTAFTTLPNTLPDTYAINDTLSVRIGTPLNGNYTIGGSLADYADFKEAEVDLNARGISGPVIFNVTAGLVYAHKPLLFENAGDLYTVTFQRNGNGINPLILSFGGEGNSDASVTLKGTNRFTFDGIDVKDSAGNVSDVQRMEYGYRIMNADAMRGAKENTIKNCSIVLNKVNVNTTGLIQTASSTGYGNTPATASAANSNNTYQNVSISNSYTGVLLTGDLTYADSNNRFVGTTTTGSVIENIGGNSGIVYGIQVNNQKSARISNITVRNMTSTGIYVYGIYVNNLQSNTAYGVAKILNNKVYNLRTTSTSTTAAGGVDGIRVDISTTGTAIVNNNIVYDLGKANLSTDNANPLIRGITHCMTGGSNAEYYNNMVSVSSGTSLNITSTAFFKGGAGTVNAGNNVFLNTTADQTANARHFAIHVNQNTPLISTHNILWSANGNGYVGRLLTSFYQTLKEWQVITSQEANSINVLPVLDYNNQLYPVLSDSTSWLLNGRGMHYAGNPTDINGVSRAMNVSGGVPDIGAYEITPIALPPLAIAIPSHIAPYQTTDTIQVFVFAGDTVASVRWHAYSDIPVLEVRQYSGERPQTISASQKHMFFYTAIEAHRTGNFSYDVDVYYRHNWTGTNPSEADIRLAKKDANTNWALVNLTSNNTNRRFISGFNQTSFSQFSGTDYADPMPVKLLSFNGKKVNETVELLWRTVSEVNNKGFEIERSIDGKNFSKVGFVKGKGTVNVQTEYAFADYNAPLNQMIFYRLKQLDHDNAFEYSNTIIIDCGYSVSLSQYTVYPNPFTDEVFVNITSASPGAATIGVNDMSGRLMLNAHARIDVGVNLVAIEEAGTLPKGIYVLTVTINGERHTSKLVRK